MTKTILLGMTAEEIAKKIGEATPEEIMEFKKLVDTMDNSEEIKEAIFIAGMEKVKNDMIELINKNDDLDEEEKVVLSILSQFADELMDTLEEEEEDEEELDLVSLLRAQVKTPQTSLVDKLKEQLEPKKSLADILREQMEPKKSLADVLREQMESDKESVTKKDILAEITENILEVELESEEMIINNHSTGYKVAINLMFVVACAANNAPYELEEEDIEQILTGVVNGLIDNGRKVEIKIAGDEVFTVIR